MCSSFVDRRDVVAHCLSFVGCSLSLPFSAASISSFAKFLDRSCVLLSLSRRSYSSARDRNRETRRPAEHGIRYRRLKGIPSSANARTRFVANLCFFVVRAIPMAGRVGEQLVSRIPCVYFGKRSRSLIDRNYAHHQRGCIGQRRVTPVSSVLSSFSTNQRRSFAKRRGKCDRA